MTEGMTMRPIASLVLFFVALAHHGLAMAVNCKDPDDLVICSVFVTVFDSNNESQCEVDAPDVKIWRDTKWTALVFILNDRTSQNKLKFQADSIQIAKGSGGTPAKDVFDDSLVRPGRRTYVLLNKNPKDEDFKYTVHILNPDTTKTCEYVDPTIHNTN
jgi:hypothetical protein